MAESNNSAVVNKENTPKLGKSGQNSETQEKNKTDKVLRPILLEEYSYEESPESLQNVMQFFESLTTSYSRIDILVGLIFLLMVEAGFVSTDYRSSESSFEFNYKRVRALSKNPPVSGLPNRNNFCIKMNLPNMQQFEVKLAIVCVSDDIIVNCFVKGIESGYFNVLLDPLTYFTSSNTNLMKFNFQNLDHLSRLIKSHIAFPAKHIILKQNGLSLPCLEDLPPEVVIIIMKKLPLTDLIEFGKTNCKYGILSRSLFKKIGKKMQ